MPTGKPIDGKVIRLWVDVPEHEWAWGRKLVNEHLENGEARGWRRTTKPRCQAARLVRTAGSPDKWLPCLKSVGSSEEVFCYMHGGKALPKVSPSERLSAHLDRVRLRAEREMAEYQKVLDMVRGSRNA